MQKLKVIVNCGAAEEWIGLCLASLKAQTYRNWEAFVTIDPCGDATLRQALASASGDDRIDIVANAGRLYSTANLVRAIGRSQADPEDVIVQLDGDDWLYLPNALELIAEAYTSPWPKEDGMWPAYPESTTQFRRAAWLATHVKTWKKWLWDLIEDRDLRGEDGEYFRAAQDVAIMFPMLDMSGWAKARHIPEPLMVYNMANPQRCSNTLHLQQNRNAELLRNRPPYGAINGPLLQDPNRLSAAAPLG